MEPHRNTKAIQAVAGAPRLFVSHLSVNKTEQDLLSVFAEFGEVESIMLLRNPDRTSRGSGLVQFKKWTHAEKAMEELNGKSITEKGKPLSIVFAQPRRPSGGHQMGETAIAPRRLFVGQLSKDATQQELFKLFSRFGEIENLSILEHNGPHLYGRAFVQYKKWSSCEAAIEELHGTFVMPGSEEPIVVKFADARRTAGGGFTAHAADQMGGYYTNSPMYARHQHQGSGDSSQSNLPPSNPGGHQINNGGRKSNNSTMNNNGGPGMPPPPLPGGIHFMPHAAMLPPGAYFQPSSPEFSNMPPPQYHIHPPHYGPLPGGPAMGMPIPAPDAEMSNGNGNRNSNNTKKSKASGSAPSHSTRYSTGGDNTPSLDGTSSMGDISDGSGELLQQVQLQQQQQQPGGAPMMMPPFMMPLPQMNAAMTHYMYMGYPYIPASFDPGMMAAAAAPPMRLPGYNSKIGKGVTDPAVYAHKLFVGQIPFEATEQDLWHMFSGFGEILELAVLRSGGISKGCAFLTYATKEEAESAIEAMHGQMMTPTKKMVVKFADHKSAVSPPSSQTN